MTIVIKIAMIIFGTVGVLQKDEHRKIIGHIWLVGSMLFPL